MNETINQTCKSGLNQLCQTIEDSITRIIAYEGKDPSIDALLPSFATTSRQIIAKMREDMLELDGDLSSMKYYQFFENQLMIYNIIHAKWETHRSDTPEDILNIARTFLDDDLDNQIGALCFPFANKLKALHSRTHINGAHYWSLVEECRKLATLPKSNSIYELFCKTIVDKVALMEIEPDDRIDILTPKDRNPINQAASQYAKLLTYLIDTETDAGYYDYDRHKQIEIDRSIATFDNENIGLRGKEAEGLLRTFLYEVNKDLNVMPIDDFLSKYTSLQPFPNNEYASYSKLSYEEGVDLPIAHAAHNIIYGFYQQTHPAFKAFRLRQAILEPSEQITFCSSVVDELVDEIYGDGLQVAKYVTQIFQT